jgi:hypothetical protein
MSTSPADMLAEIGRALHGDNWRKPLARDLGLNDETLRRWMSGRQELPASHGVFMDALRIVEGRRQAIGLAAARLEHWIDLQRRG